MRFSNSHGFGCNILVCQQFETGWNLPGLVTKIRNRVRKCRANILLINVSEDNGRFDQMIDRVESLGFPVIAIHKIPSSMDDYKTHLYMLDVSQVPKSWECRREGTEFSEIDDEYGQED